MSPRTNSIGTAEEYVAVAEPRQLFVRPNRAVAVAVVLLAAVLLLAVALPDGPLRIDTAWSEAMQDISSGALDRLAHGFDRLGSGWLRGLTIAAVCVALLIGRRLAGLAAYGVVMALTPLLVNLIKAAVDRPRPPHAVVQAAASSFPSGHAAYGAATAVSLVVLFAPIGRRRIWIVAGVAFAAGMAWSRTYLQVHWLSDVTGGAMLGAGVALAVLAAAQLLVDRLPPRPPWSAL
jgi:membrane-associated phospholipid phosphatase